MLARLAANSTTTAAAAAASVVGGRAYHKAVVDHYERPRNVGSFDKNDPNVGTGLVGECGTFACVAGAAAAAAAAEGHHAWTLYSSACSSTEIV